eukprot:gnl/MRDRNA2_/MRDRNA2_236186_c0_seq1.p1 gnl/MRDRNA2_/MRDRNA2_236186_c0~~gnl/MRDRNA2_/MRDRNA2_236186_c0_seq1.p1  ORF type:complete len:234 (-),score=36.52 gnl/MRDRNA2_/MRDRNA2_236186_c0_seq1:164-826(-)
MVLDYSKWEKMATALDFSSDSEQEAEIASKNPVFVERRYNFLAIPPQAFMPGGKQKLMGLVGTLPNITSRVQEDVESLFESYTSQTTSVANQTVAAKKICEMFSWQRVGSEVVPALPDGDRWCVFYDSSAQSMSAEENPAGRALILEKARGWFVIGCISQKTNSYLPISRKQVADIIIRRINGDDSARIHELLREDRNKVKMIEETGVNDKGNWGPEYSQ